VFRPKVEPWYSELLLVRHTEGIHSCNSAHLHWSNTQHVQYAAAQHVAVPLRTTQRHHLWYIYTHIVPRTSETRPSPFYPTFHSQKGKKRHAYVIHMHSNGTITPGWWSLQMQEGRWAEWSVAIGGIWILLANVEGSGWNGKSLLLRRKRYAYSRVVLVSRGSYSCTGGEQASMRYHPILHRSRGRNL